MSLLNTPVPVNAFDFSEISSNDKQPLITNNLGRAVTIAELVYLGGYFGDVVEQDGIANAATGRINIDSDRIIRTEQIEATDTFTVGNTLWFVSGGAGAAGKLEDADPGSGTRVAVGIITGEGGAGGAQTYVEFRPFAQRLDAADVSAQVTLNTAGIATNVTDIATNAGDIVTNAGDITTLQGEMLVEQAEPKKYVQKIVADASGGVALTGLSEGDEIIDITIIATVSEASGTLQVRDGAANAISDAIICAVDTTVTRAGTLDDAFTTLPASGADVIAAGGTAGNIRGIVIVDYIPA